VKGEHSSLKWVEVWDRPGTAFVAAQVYQIGNKHAGKRLLGHFAQISQTNGFTLMYMHLDAYNATPTYLEVTGVSDSPILDINGGADVSECKYSGYNIHNDAAGHIIAPGDIIAATNGGADAGATLAFSLLIDNPFGG
jgi:hypothetical protein